MGDDSLREQLARFLDWEEAHVGFDKAVDGLAADKRGARATGFEHSVWQLVEHLRLAQKARAGTDRKYIVEITAHFHRCSLTETLGSAFSLCRSKIRTR